jgi:hypothetical protein
VILYFIFPYRLANMLTASYASLIFVKKVILDRLLNKVAFTLEERVSLRRVVKRKVLCLVRVVSIRS